MTVIKIEDAAFDVEYHSGAEMDELMVELHSSIMRSIFEQKLCPDCALGYTLRFIVTNLIHNAAEPDKCIDRVLDIVQTSINTGLHIIAERQEEEIRPPKIN